MRKGFTLIELLVVIAIIAILAAILFPIFIRARQMGNQTKCGAHGREIGMAMMMYMEDNHGYFPSNASSEAISACAGIKWTYDWPGTPWDDGTWGVGQLNAFRYIQLAKYAQRSDVWVCPSPEGLYGSKYTYGYRCCWFFIRGKIGYGSLRESYPDTPFQTSGIGRTLIDVLAEDRKAYGRYVTPSRKIFCFCYSLGPDIPVEAYSGSPNLITPYYPHNEGSIYVYADGHARWRMTGRGWAAVGYTNHPYDKPHRR